MARAFKMDIIHKEFDRALEQIIRESSRSTWTVLNSQAYHFCARAARNTRKVEASKIESELGLNKVEVPGKDGRPRFRKRWAQQSLAIAIIMSRIIKKSGRDALALFSNRDIANRAKRMIRSRVRARAFLSSGWRGALRRLATTFPSRDRARSRIRSSEFGRTRGKEKGFAKPAPQNLIGSMTAIVVNSATKDSPRALAIIRKGADQAMIETVADMRRHLKSKMKPIEQKHNGRRR